MFFFSENNIYGNKVFQKIMFSKIVFSGSFHKRFHNMEEVWNSNFSALK